MKRAIASIVASAFVLTAIIAICQAPAGVAWGVKPPPSDSQDKARAAHEQQKKEKGKEIRSSGCPYGKDKKSGKCYQPKEGEFYQDAQGNIHRKETTCYNLPWKPCSGSKQAPETKKSDTKKSGVEKKTNKN